MCHCIVAMCICYDAMCICIVAMRTCIDAKCICIVAMCICCDAKCTCIATKCICIVTTRLFFVTMIHLPVDEMQRQANSVRMNEVELIVEVAKRGMEYKTLVFSREKRILHG